MIKFKTQLLRFSILCLFAITWTLQANGQAYRDELKQKSERHIKCDTVPQLADSVFSAIKTRIFDSLEVYTPSSFRTGRPICINQTTILGAQSIQATQNFAGICQTKQNQPKIY
jgi:hypothetical protein